MLDLRYVFRFKKGPANYYREIILCRKGAGGQREREGEERREEQTGGKEEVLSSVSRNIYIGSETRTSIVLSFVFVLLLLASCVFELRWHMT